MIEREKQLILGIDIDGTITDPGSFIPYLNKAFNKQHTYTDIVQYDLTPYYGVSGEEFDKWFMENGVLVYGESPLVADVRDILDELQHRHKLVYISARDLAHMDTTVDWFARNSVPYHHIELIGTHHKIEAAKKYNVNIFFEDKYDNACDISEALDIPVLLFDTPYNQGPLPEKSKRIFNWLEAKKFIDQYAHVHSLEKMARS